MDKNNDTNDLALGAEAITARPEVLNLKEAAELLRVPLHTMYYLLEHGQLKGRRVGKEYRLTRTALMDWLNSDGGRAA